MADDVKGLLAAAEVAAKRATGSMTDKEKKDERVKDLVDEIKIALEAGYKDNKDYSVEKDFITQLVTAMNKATNEGTDITLPYKGTDYSGDVSDIIAQRILTVAKETFNERLNEVKTEVQLNDPALPALLKSNYDADIKSAKGDFKKQLAVITKYTGSLDKYQDKATDLIPEYAHYNKRGDGGATVNTMDVKASEIADAVLDTIGTYNQLTESKKAEKPDDKKIASLEKQLTRQLTALDYLYTDSSSEIIDGSRGGKNKDATKQAFEYTVSRIVEEKLNITENKEAKDNIGDFLDTVAKSKDMDLGDLAKVIEKPHYDKYTEMTTPVAKIAGSSRTTSSDSRSSGRSDREKQGDFTAKLILAGAAAGGAAIAFKGMSAEQTPATEGKPAETKPNKLQVAVGLILTAAALLAITRGKGDGVVEKLTTGLNFAGQGR